MDAGEECALLATVIWNRQPEMCLKSELDGDGFKTQASEC